MDDKQRQILYKNLSELNTKYSNKPMCVIEAAPNDFNRTAVVAEMDTILGTFRLGYDSHSILMDGDIVAARISYSPENETYVNDFLKAIRPLITFDNIERNNKFATDKIIKLRMNRSPKFSTNGSIKL